MRKSVFFIILIVLGICGRWLLLPEVKRITIMKLYEEKKQNKVDILLTCLANGRCEKNEIFNGKIIFNKEKLQSLRSYLIKNKNKIIGREFYRLRALVLTDADLMGPFLNELKHISLKNLSSFIYGLFLCHSIRCRNFYVEKKNFFKKISMQFSDVDLDLNILKLSLKENKHWKEKGKVLRKYLEMLKKNKKIDDVIDIIKYIPNHPLLKRFVMVNYLEIKKQYNIKVGAIYLARYYGPWHFLKYKEIFISKSYIHKKNFILSLKITCPKNIKQIYSMFQNDEKLLDDLFLESRYLFSKQKDLPQKLNKRNEFKSIKYSKCLERSRKTLSSFYFFSENIFFIS